MGDTLTDWDSCSWAYAVQALATLGRNFDVAAGLAAMKQLGYQKGFDDATTLREFCQPNVVFEYFPVGDSRPTAERLQWVPTK